jgi:hypothetical protein
VQHNNVCQFLPFTDDIKNFHAFSAFDGCTQVKLDTDSVQGWRTGNLMIFCISKTQSTTFSRKINTFVFKYKLGDSYITHIHCIKDLGVLILIIVSVSRWLYFFSNHEGFGPRA